MAKNFICAVALLCVLNSLGAFPDNQVTTSNGTPIVYGLKSKGTAYLWSLGFTVVPLIPYGLGAPISVIIGPSAGHCYAGNWGQGLKGAGIRLGVAAAGIGAAAALSARLGVAPRNLDVKLLQKTLLGQGALFFLEDEKAREKEILA